MTALVRRNVSDKIPNWGAAISAVSVGVAWIALPTGWLDDAVAASGVATLVPLAMPPIGFGVRALLALGAGILAAIVVWGTLRALFGAKGMFVREAPLEEGAPIVRRADAHPDAPARRPLSIAELTQARDLDDERDRAAINPIEHCIPADLDTPLSALDPGAIPLVPRQPVRPVAPLSPGERMRTFALVPPPPPRPDASDGARSIEGLLRRLGMAANSRGGNA